MALTIGRPHFKFKLVAKGDNFFCPEAIHLKGTQTIIDIALYIEMKLLKKWTFDLKSPISLF